MPCRGVRGAVSVTENTSQAIQSTALELLEALIEANGLEASAVASVIFTVTSDLDAAYPAPAARMLGWDTVPLLCMQEMTVPGTLPRCIRVLIHWNTDRAQAEIRHVYLGEARRLRPDLVGNES